MGASSVKIYGGDMDYRIIRQNILIETTEHANVNMSTTYSSLPLCRRISEADEIRRDCMLYISIQVSAASNNPIGGGRVGERNQ
jgi:hypothetical protein